MILEFAKRYAYKVSSLSDPASKSNIHYQEYVYIFLHCEQINFSLYAHLLLIDRFRQYSNFSSQFLDFLNRDYFLRILNFRLSIFRNVCSNIWSMFEYMVGLCLDQSLTLYLVRDVTFIMMIILIQIQTHQFILYQKANRRIHESSLSNSLIPWSFWIFKEAYFLISHLSSQIYIQQRIIAYLRPYIYPNSRIFYVHFSSSGIQVNNFIQINYLKFSFFESFQRHWRKYYLCPIMLISFFDSDLINMPFEMSINISIPLKRVIKIFPRIAAPFFQTTQIQLSEFWDGDPHKITKADFFIIDSNLFYTYKNSEVRFLILQILDFNKPLIITLRDMQQLQIVSIQVTNLLVVVLGVSHLVPQFY